MSEDKRNRDPFNARYDRGDKEEAKSEETDPASEDPKMEQTVKSAESKKTSKNEETDSTSKDSKTGKAVKGSKSKKTSKSEETATVRERKNVNMYLPEGLVSDLQLRYSELNVEWRRQHDEDLPKNDQFYPAVIRASLGETSIEEELGLEVDEE